MRTLFVRHAESVNNTLWAEISPDRDAFFRRRVADAPLTDRGRMQTELVAKRFGVEAPDVTEIWTSYLQRALDTAATIATSLSSAKVRVMRDLYEVGGHYAWQEGTGNVGSPGLRNRDVAAQYPSFDVDPQCEEGWWTGSGPEKEGAAAERAKALVKEIGLQARAGRKDTVIIVTHGDFFNIIVMLLQGHGAMHGAQSSNREPINLAQVLFRNTGITGVRWDENGAPFIEFLNCGKHLDGVIEDVPPGAFITLADRQEDDRDRETTKHGRM